MHIKFNNIIYKTLKDIIDNLFETILQNTNLIIFCFYNLYSWRGNRKYRQFPSIVFLYANSA